MRLNCLAKAIARIKIPYARERAMTSLEDLEDLYLADKGMKALKSGKVKAIPIDQVELNLRHIYKSCLK